MKPSGRCVIEGCERRRDSRGMCKSHWGRWRRHGDPLAGGSSPTGGNCTVDDCDRPHAARGLCVMHWYRWRRNGDPAIAKPRLAIMPGSANSHWLTDDDVTYPAAHYRVKIVRGSASGYACVDCGQPAAHWSYDNTDPDERTLLDRGRMKTFSLKIEHYEPRCARCHRRFDIRTRAARRAIADERGLTFGTDGRSRPLRASVAAQNGQLVRTDTPEPLEAK